MDQVTQILLGGTAAQAAFGHRLGWRAAAVGAFAGFVPDLDVLAKPLADPIFPMEVHRTFSHALVAMPVGALLVGTLFMAFRGYRRFGPWLYAAALVGWATHAPLDACTSYGTMLLWPFDRTWIAWDLVAIVDPVFTLTLLIGLVLALRRGRTRPAWIALALAIAYLGLGSVQRERALVAQAELAALRGDRIEHGRAIPVLGSLLFWRSLYRTDDEVVADQIRLVPGAEPAVLAGDRAPRFRAEDLPSDVEDVERAAPVFARYVTFTDGFACRTPTRQDVAGDPRYSITAGIDPVWGVSVVPGARPAWVDLAEVGERDVSKLAGTMLGTAGTYVPVSALRNAPEGGE